MTYVQMKVGELAERTGLTVRTLHWYDEIGLLEPGRTPSGHRVYGPKEVERLQRILSLRQVGLSVDQIQEALDRPELSLLEEREEEVGEDRMREAQEGWRELYGRLGEARTAGSEPTDPEVRKLARKAESLIREFTGGDPGIRASLEKLYREEGSRPMEVAGWDVDLEVQGFLGRAMGALREEGEEA